ncbi:hypothetical protein B2J88_18855 [Rhodococcus sp. SRB_17]|jgi:hypothetical protein|uniref:hypothetical protein n=1 Tax=Rhodococcus sp. ARC_M6 TaxID=2928852 RepID=UPI00146A7FAB|nr:hypothetical protein [Rhodococcus sp. ARC_M6]MCJ0902685.1 hypothetical protein [Rhodococcus sp. ARC_M6]NMM86397.1 hypothetical protein [Rhodococcus sp. SRB_17]
MTLRASHIWKLVGLAGVMGVAATGVLAARNERTRRAYSPDEIRSVLHERYTQAYAKQSVQEEIELEPVPSALRRRMKKLIRRRS